MNDDLQTLLQSHFKATEAKRRTQQFVSWCQALDQASPRFKPRVKGSLVADIELQPHRWLSAGLDILRSAHATSYLQLMNGKRGEALQSYLPYSVFLAGTELFLKGMWLCRRASCRRVGHASYVNERVRRGIDQELRSHGHDLLKLIARLRRLGRYRSDPTTLRFLRRISAIVRLYYFPLYQSDQTGSWATARYPKRFYNDHARTARANALNSYPDQHLVVSLFEPMERHLDNLWQLRIGLMKPSK